VIEPLCSNTLTLLRSHPLQPAIRTIYSITDLTLQSESTIIHELRLLTVIIALVTINQSDNVCLV